MMPVSSLPICPTCKQSDQIQKVTSLYAVNTKEWDETHSHTDAWGHSHSVREHKEAHTSLGLKLKPPPKPATPTHPGFWYGIGGFVALILLTSLCPLAFIPLSFAVPLIVGAEFLPKISEVPNWVVTTAAVGAPLLCCGGGALAGLAWLGFKVKGRFERDMKSYREKKALFERDELPRWERARGRWERLYYCMRDETVFMPGENRAVRAEDLERYLYGF